MKLMPIVYVTDMERSSRFYAALGLKGDVQDRAAMWAEFTLGDAVLALHHIDQVPTPLIGQVELAMVSDEPLETVAERLRAAGVALEREITDEAFGRSIQVRDPDGLVIQINEHVVELYT